MQVNDDLATDPIDVVAALPAQPPCHGRNRASIDLLAVVLIGADVPVLAEGATHVARSKEDRPRSRRAAIKQLLASMMEMCAHPGAGGELAGTKLGASAP